MILYVTEMLRFGDPESHHYVVGLFSTESVAVFAGEVEKTWRGGKYEYHVTKCEVDAAIDAERLAHHEDCKP